MSVEQIIYNRRNGSVDFHGPNSFKSLEYFDNESPTVYFRGISKIYLTKYEKIIMLGVQVRDEIKSLIINDFSCLSIEGKQLRYKDDNWENYILEMGNKNDAHDLYVKIMDMFGKSNKDKSITFQSKRIDGHVWFYGEKDKCPFYKHYGDMTYVKHPTHVTIYKSETDCAIIHIKTPNHRLSFDVRDYFDLKLDGKRLIYDDTLHDYVIDFDSKEMAEQVYDEIYDIVIKRDVDTD